MMERLTYQIVNLNSCLNITSPYVILRFKVNLYHIDCITDVVYDNI